MADRPPFQLEVFAEGLASRGDLLRLTSLVEDLRAMPGVDAKLRTAAGPTLQSSKGSADDIVLMVSATAAVLTAVAPVMRAWLARQSARRVTLKMGDEVVDLQGISAEAQGDALDAFLKRHEGDIDGGDVV